MRNKSHTLVLVILLLRSTPTNGSLFSLGSCAMAYTLTRSADTGSMNYIRTKRLTTTPIDLSGMMLRAIHESKWNRMSTRYQPWHTKDYRPANAKINPSWYLESLVLGEFFVVVEASSIYSSLTFCW